MNLVVVGHVDNGKSTIVGHLLVDMGVIDQRTIDAFAKNLKLLERGYLQVCLGVIALRTREKEVLPSILLSRNLKPPNIFTL
jgi:translation elongation factor EF-1alpha